VCQATDTQCCHAGDSLNPEWGQVVVRVCVQGVFRVWSGCSHMCGGVIRIVVGVSLASQRPGLEQRATRWFTTHHPRMGSQPTPLFREAAGPQQPHSSRSSNSGAAGQATTLPAREALGAMSLVRSTAVAAQASIRRHKMERNARELKGSNQPSGGLGGGYCVGGGRQVVVGVCGGWGFRVVCFLRRRIKTST